MKTILICGGRDFGFHESGARNDDEVEKFIVAWAELVRKHHGFLMINGGCKSGADKLARGCATIAEIDCVTIPAKWSTEGRAAGPLRNQRMLDQWHPTAVVAFPGGRGTADMVRRARAAGVPVWLPYGGVDA